MPPFSRTLVSLAAAHVIAHSRLSLFLSHQVLGGMPDRDPMDFVTMETGDVAKGKWGEESTGGDAGAMDEDDEEEEGDESMEVVRRVCLPFFFLLLRFNCSSFCC